MRNVRRVTLLALAVGALACSGARSQGPTDGSGGPLDPTSSVGSSSLAAPSAGDFPPGECGYPPPDLSHPTDGAVVSGSVRLVMAIPEGPCNITASAVIRIFDASGLPVAERCAFALDPFRPWNTQSLPDGAYTITTQRACSCNPCAETSTLHVTVRNNSH